MCRGVVGSPWPAATAHTTSHGHRAEGGENGMKKLVG